MKDLKQALKNFENYLDEKYSGLYSNETTGYPEDLFASEMELYCESNPELLKAMEAFSKWSNRQGLYLDLDFKKKKRKRKKGFGK